MPNHLRHAARTLRHAPAFTLTVVATLAIGIGLNAAIFTVVDNVLLKPLGYRDADRIVAILSHFNEENRSIPRLAGDDYVDLARDIKSLEVTAQYHAYNDGFALNGASLYGPVATVTSGFTDVMGVQPLAGRLSRPDDRDGSDVLISASFLRAHFSSPQSAIGQPITYSGRIFTVVGVLPEGFNFPSNTQAWFEMHVETGNRSSYNNRVVARRRAGVSDQTLSAELATLSSGLARAYPEDRKKSIEAIPLKEQLVFRIRPTLRLLMGSVAVILFIVCANIAHLQLVRATRQLRALTIRTALGASRAQLALRGLTETALLALAGAAVALLIAIPALHLLATIAPSDTPPPRGSSPQPRRLLLSLLLSIVLMAVTAMLPIWRSWHVDPAQTLRSDASRGTESRSSTRLRSTFIVAEIALTLTLSIAAIVLTRQLIAQSHQDLGFSPESLLTVDARLRGRLRELGEDVAEMLEYVRACFKVIRHVRPKLSCDGCDRIVQAPAPSRPIDRGLAGPGLLAHVLVAKYADSLPLYRQSEIYSREGVDLDRSTLAGWVGATADLLAPVVEAVRAHVMAATKLHADDTPVPVLAPGNGRTKTGRLWTYVRGSRPSADPTPPAVWFAYSPDRCGEHPQGHLKLYRGALQADAYAGFHPLYEGGKIAEVACWRTLAASSTRSTSRTPRPPRPRPSSESPRSTPSKPRSEAARRRSGCRSDRRGRGLCSTASEAGSNSPSPSSPASPTPRRRSATPSRAGPR